MIPYQSKYATNLARDVFYDNSGRGDAGVQVYICAESQIKIVMDDKYTKSPQSLPHPLSLSENMTASIFYPVYDDDQFKAIVDDLDNYLK